MADLPNIYDLLHANYLTQAWTALNGVNRFANGTLRGALPEATSADIPTAEWRNGVIGGLRQLHQWATGAAEIDQLRIADVFKLPRYTTAQRPAAGNVGNMIYDTDLDTILVDDGAAWDDLGGTGTGAARTVLGRSANSSGTRADIAGGGTASIPQYLTDDGTTVAFRSGTSLWSGRDTYYDVNLAGLATNTFADGSESIDGLTWTVGNTATAGATWGVVNGQGIQIAAPTSSANTWTLADTTQAPHVYIPLSSIPNWQPGSTLIVDMYMSAGVFENGNDCARMGLWRVAGEPASTSTAAARMIDRGNNGGTQTVRTFDGTTVTAFPDAQAVNAISAVFRPDGFMTLGTGTYTSDWPTFDYKTAFVTTLTAVNQVATGLTRFLLTLINASDASPTTTVSIARLRFRRG